MAAWPLVHAGLNVLMIERGPWVKRGPGNWEPAGTLFRTPYFNGGSEFYAHTQKGRNLTASCSCVGGASVFYGGVSLRFRERDFIPDPEIVTNSGSRWPFSYEQLRPYYLAAERILHVAGVAGLDPTEPRREQDYPAEPSGLSEVSKRIGEGARSLGLRPFPLPLAMMFASNGSGPRGRSACQQCGTCDTFACAVGAKNDVATQVLPTLMTRGLDLLPETAVTRLVMEAGRIARVECLDRTDGSRRTFTADRFLLAGGAISSAHLLIASGVHEQNPAGDSVGRYLTRHCAAIVYGGYSWIPNHADQFHKQLGIHDFYFGDPDGSGPVGKLGGIQQVQTPSMGTVEAVVPRILNPLLRPLVTRSTGLLALAEERPQYANRVSVDLSETDEVGLPRLIVEHEYSDRDYAARQQLIDRAKQIHRSAGSPVQHTHRIDTFSHALGTVRMGDDPARDPLDADCRFRGVDNLFVVDGSALPTGGGVNPSLTIAANALRAGDRIVMRAREEGEFHKRRNAVARTITRQSA